MESFLRTDASECQTELAFRMRTPSVRRNTVFDVRKKLSILRTGTALRPGDAMKKGFWARKMKGFWRIIGWRKVQRGDNRHILRGHILQKIQTVHVHDINCIFVENSFDCEALLLVGRFQRFSQ